MKFTNNEIIQFAEGLGALMQDSVPLPASVSFAVVRNFKLLQPIAEDIYREREKILDRYNNGVTQLEDGRAVYSIPEDKREFANQELEDLLAVKTSVPLVTFSLDKLTGYDIPLKTMNILYFMVEDGEGA